MAYLNLFFSGSPDDPFAQLHVKLDTLLAKETQMALDQATFDAELSGLVSAIDELIAAVDAIPPADLTAEGQAVTDAAAKVQAELAKLAPAA